MLYICDIAHLCCPIRESSLDVSCQLGRPVQRDKHCDIDQGAPLLLQTGARPDGTPASLSDELLHWPCEFGAILQGLLDIFGTIDLRAELDAFVKDCLVGCGNFVISWRVVGGRTHFGRNRAMEQSLGGCMVDLIYGSKSIQKPRLKARDVTSTVKPSDAVTKRFSDVRRADLTSVGAKPPQTYSFYLDSPHAQAGLGI